MTRTYKTTRKRGAVWRIVRELAAHSNGDKFTFDYVCSKSSLTPKQAQQALLQMAEKGELRIVVPGKSATWHGPGRPTVFKATRKLRPAELTGKHLSHL